MSDDPIAKLEARVSKLEGIIAGLAAVLGGGGGTEAATDRELDAPDGKGDPDVRFAPRDWHGEPVPKGTRFSRCAPEFLEALADAYLHFAAKNDSTGAQASGKPKSFWDKRSARLALGWARRIRAGWTPPPPPPRPSFGGANGAPTGMSQGTSGGFGSRATGSRFGGGGKFGKSAEPDCEPDDNFNFGHNRRTTEEHDDDPPL